MLKINFHPDSDLEDFHTGVAEYEKIWKEEGERITTAWTKITGLNFRENFINATVFHCRGYSHPLTLRHTLDLGRKKAVLVHELGHRLLYKLIKMGAQSSLLRHKVLFLALYDVLVDLYGDEFAQETVAWDKELDKKFGNNIYSEAWDYALSFSPEERKREFLKSLA